MKHLLPSIIVKNPGHFEIECETVVTVRIEDKRTKLYKTVRLERKSDPIVTATLKDCAGAMFKVSVSLLSGGATLFYPDFSGANEGELIARHAVKVIEEIFTAVK